MNFKSTIAAMKREAFYFDATAPVFIARAPGRLDLMGGNDDYTGGLVFESTIREGTYCAAQLRSDFQVQLLNKPVVEKGWEGKLILSLDQLRDQEAVRTMAASSPKLRWTSYVLGNIHYLLTRFPGSVLTGITLYMDSDVPFNRGVSSSAAIEVAVMKACAAAYNIPLAGIELALACQWVENVIAVSGCGIMDQAAVVLGKAGYVMPLLCQPCSPEELVKLPEALKVWGIDSGVSHQVSGIEYEAARAAAFMGYKMICDAEGIEVQFDEQSIVPRYTDAKWNGYLANIEPSDFYSRYEKMLPVKTWHSLYLEESEMHVDPMSELRKGVTYNVHANTKYAIEENHRVKLFVTLSGAAVLSPSPRVFQLMGELMYQSHQAYSECGLSAVATDELVSLARNEGISNGVYGAKITGGGAGGTVAILASADASETIARIFDQYKLLDLGSPYLFEGSSDGADCYGIVQL